MALGRGEMEGVNVFWGPPPKGSALPGLRRFKVAIGSEVLWRHYAAGGTAHSCALATLDQLDRDMVDRLPSTRTVRVRRVDVCIDHWGFTWSGVDLTRFVCRQTSRGLEERSGRGKRATQLEDVGREARIDEVKTVYGKNSATYYIGARGSASRYLRVYNKIAEAQHSGKLPWMEPAWRAAGWDGKATVWRAEIEHGGDWLTDHGLDTLDRLEGCERALWRAYFDDVRHVTPNRSRRKRSATSRVWLCLRGSIRREERRAKRDRLVTAWTWQPRPPRVAGDMPAITAMGAGCGRRLRDTMFHGDNEATARYLVAAMLAADQRDLERQPKPGASCPWPRPLPEPQPPPPRRPSPIVAQAERRGAAAAAETARGYVPRAKDRPWLTPSRGARITSAPSPAEDAFGA